MITYFLPNSIGWYCWKKYINHCTVKLRISTITCFTVNGGNRSRVSKAIEIRWNWVWWGNATFRMNVRSIGRVATGTGSARVRHPPLLIRGMLLIIHLILRPLQIIDKLPSAIKRPSQVSLWGVLVFVFNYFKFFRCIVPSQSISQRSSFTRNSFIFLIWQIAQQ